MPTGIEEIGFALGVVSLGFQAFAGCIQAFEFLSSAHHFGKDAELLVCMLKLEEYKLILWSKKSGLIDDKLDPRLNAEIIFRALGEIRALLQDTKKLKERYHLDLKEDTKAQTMPIAQPHSPIQILQSDEAAKFLRTDSILQEREKIITRAGLESRKPSLAKRLWWAAVDKKGMEELIAKVGGLVQELFGILTVLDSEDVKQRLQLMQLTLVSLAETVDGIKLVQNVVIEEAKSTKPNETLTAVAGLKALSINSNSTVNAGSEAHVPPLRRRLLTKVQPIPSSGMATALYENTPVVLETKRYKASEASGSNVAVISTRICNLTAFLNAPKPPSFRTLHCAGVIQNSLKLEYQFVFDRPPQSRASNIPPRSLLTLLQSSFMPSLSARFKLAAELATTLLHLHAGGWLHKGFRSENILFFPPTEDAPRTLEEPYVTGFEYSRHDGSGEISQKPSQDPAEDIYRHPLAQGPASSGFTKAFDVYALGVTLLEIAYWRSFSEILHKLGVKMKDVSPETMQKVRDRIILDNLDKEGDKIAQNLRFKMGDEYTKVVLCCLGDAWEDEDPAAKEEYLADYYDLVVRRLRKCVGI